MMTIENTDMINMTDEELQILIGNLQNILAIRQGVTGYTDLTSRYRADLTKLQTELTRRQVRKQRLALCNDCKMYPPDYPPGTCWL